MSTNTLRDAGGNLYLVFHFVYNRKLQLESIATAGREVLKKFANLQPKPSEEDGELLDVFTVRDSFVETVEGPRTVDPAKPFWAVLGPGKDEGTSMITVTISHQEADAFSLGRFVQAWACQYAGQSFPDPEFGFEALEAQLDASLSPEVPENAGFMSAADLKPDGPPTLGVGLCIDLGRARLEPLRKALIDGVTGDVKGSFTLNTLRMALMWKAFIVARKLDKDEATSICWAVNVRQRPSVSVADNYFGNAAINSPRVQLKVEEVSNMALLELAQLLQKSVTESATSQSILFTLSKMKASIAANGPVIPSQRRSLFGPKQSILLYSDWSGFDLNPAFDGGKADAVISMFGEGKMCPIGIGANNPEGLYIGVKAEEVDDFKAACNKVLTA